MSNTKLTAEKEIMAYTDWDLDTIMEYLLKGQGWNGFDSSAIKSALPGRVKMKVTLEVSRRWK